MSTNSSGFPTNLSEKISQRSPSFYRKIQYSNCRWDRWIKYRYTTAFSKQFCLWFLYSLFKKIANSSPIYATSFSVQYILIIKVKYSPMATSSITISLLQHGLLSPFGKLLPKTLQMY